MTLAKPRLKLFEVPVFAAEKKKKKTSWVISHLLVGVCSVCRSMIIEASEHARVWPAKPGFFVYCYMHIQSSTDYKE